MNDETKTPLTPLPEKADPKPEPPEPVKAEKPVEPPKPEPEKRSMALGAPGTIGDEVAKPPEPEKPAEKANLDEVSVKKVKHIINECPSGAVVKVCNNDYADAARREAAVKHKMVQVSVQPNLNTDITWRLPKNL